MKNKKLVATLLVATMALSMIGCGSSTQETTSDKTEQTETTAASDANAGDASADIDFPTIGFNIICPWAAGGSSDLICRTFAEMIPDYMGQSCTVTNQEGAGGTIAATDFLTADADGYNLIQFASGVFEAQPLMRDVTYKIEDYTAIACVTYEPLILWVNKDLGVTNAEEMVAYGQTNDVNIGQSGAGGLPDFAAQGILKQMGINGVSTPFDGESEAIAQLLGGHVQAAVTHPTAALQYYKDGTFVPIMIFAEERDEREELKDIPCSGELGYNVNFSVWKWLAVPKDTPDEIVSYLREKFDEMQKDDRWNEFLENSQLAGIDMDPNDVTDRINTEFGEIKEIMGM